jgi:hypothetical protein
VNLKFAAGRPFGFLAKTFDGRENFVCGFGPSIGLGIFIVALDEGVDICFQLLC